MKTESGYAAVCPICGQAYSGWPAISRTDNKTPICPDCGIRQALADAGFAENDREAVLAVIHRYECPSETDG